MIGPVHVARDCMDRLPVAARGNGEAGLDDIDAELSQCLRDPQLLRQRHAAAGRLLAIAQRRVEDQDPIGISGHGWCSAV